MNGAFSRVCIEVSLGSSSFYDQPSEAAMPTPKEVIVKN
jgi:hypothetical protein